MGVVVHVGALATVLGVAVGAGALPASGEIVSYVDQKGRHVYVNSEDDELRLAATRGGVPAALELMERRKRSLPGISEHIAAEARSYAIDPQLVHAIIEVESGWNPYARSQKGALGLMQLLPATAARFGVSDLFDARQNVSAGIRYFRFLLDRFDNDVELALAGYNAGENAVEAAGGVPVYRETQQYVERLRSLYGKFGRASARRLSGIYSEVDADGRVVYTNE